MNTREHVRLLWIATATWAVFWLAGLPSYYQQYSTAGMVWFEGALVPVLAVLVYYTLRRVRLERRFGLARWIAFYFTVPLALYDWLYCGVYLGHGFSFIWRYWYLTTYYVVPWLLLPGIAAMLNRSERRALRGREGEATPVDCSRRSG